MGIATATGVPYPRVSDALKAHVHDGLVEVHREHVREFAGEGKMKTFRLTPQGWTETERLLSLLTQERIELEDGSDPVKSVSAAEAIRNPPSWLPHRLGDLADLSSGPGALTGETVEQCRQFLGLRRAIVRELQRAHSENRIPIVERSSLERRLGAAPAQVEAALRSLAQEMVVEVKPVKAPEGRNEGWVRLKSEPYARFALRGEDLAPRTPSPRSDVVPDSSGLCLAARRWLTTAEKFRIEDLQARPIETGDRARILVIHVPSGSRFEVTVRGDGRVVDYHTT